MAQPIRAGGSALTVTVTSSTPSVGLINSLTGSAASATATIPVGAAQTGGSVAAGGVAFDPVAAGTTTVSATIPGFVTTTDASALVTVTGPGMTLYSPMPYPGYSGPTYPRYVGAGLQDGPYWVQLGASGHGGRTVRITSSNAAIALVAPNATTPGTAFIDVLIADGATDASFYVQGLEGQVGSVTVSAVAPGFTGAATGTIEVVTAGYRITTLPSTIPATGETTVFVVEVGVPITDGTDLLSQFYTGTSQAVRPGGLLTATVTNSNATGAQLITASGGDQTWAVNILAGQSTTASSVGTGGIALDPLSGACSAVGCDTFVDANIPGLVKTLTATRTVQITP